MFASPGFCELCAEIGDSEASDVECRQAWRGEGRPMWMTPSFVLFPTLGPLSLGHMLLTPRDHITAYGHLPRVLHEEANTALRSARQYLRRFGSPLCFEHGSANELGAGGCGVVHAHMHVLPLRSSVTGRPPIAAAEWELLSADNWLEGLCGIVRRGVSYVYFESQATVRSVTPVSSLPSQFVRKWIAEQIGISQWDWRASDRLTDLADPMRWMHAGAPPAGFSNLG